jgi:hypothetical protein
MTTARFDTARTIVNEALVELGLSSNEATDVWASTDPVYVQARGLLKSCGQELISMPATDWQSLHKTHALTAAAAVAPAIYGVNALPADFDHYVPQTAWDQTNQQRVLDASKQTWEAALVSLVATQRSYALIDADQLLLYPPNAGAAITIRYGSRYWVAPAATPTVLGAAAPAANGDVVFFTPLLIKRLLKLRIALAKGMESTALLADFESTLEVEQGKHAPAPVLDMAGGGQGIHFIDETNLPANVAGI